MFLHNIWMLEVILLYFSTITATSALAQNGYYQYGNNLASSSAYDQYAAGSASDPYRFPQSNSFMASGSDQYSDPYSYGNSNRNSNRNSNPITIGLLTDRQHEEMAQVVKIAIKNANEKRGTQISDMTEQIPYGNSFLGYGKLCNMMQMGIGALFGPSSKHTAFHLMSICDAKDIPYFYSFMGEVSEAFNLYPHQEDLANALYSVLEAYEWSQFIFLYESAEYLKILNSVMSHYNYTSMPTITVLRYDMSLDGNYKDILRRVRKATEKKIVVVGSVDTMPEFLRQAQQVGLINEAYKYIIANLDFHSFDLEEFKYSEANITSFRMFSPENPAVQEIMDGLGYNSLNGDFKNGSCPITMEMALTYDAIQLFAETTSLIPLIPVPLNCSESSDSVKDDGSTFKNYMRSIDMEKDTLTGRIYFDGNIRKGFTFDVIELQPSGIVRVGTWDEIRNYTSERLAPTNAIFDSTDNSLANKTFKILLSVPNKPYASIVESHKKLEGNSQYEGYGVELIKMLSVKLGFNYEFTPMTTDYGSFDPVTNVSTGMLKDIREGRYHLAVSDLTITSERQAAIDFTIPFMNLGISILFLKPQKETAAIFSFMDPFNNDVWQALGLSFLLVSLSFFILGRLAPSEWDNPIPCIEEPTELENQFTLSNSIWFTTGALLQQGSDVAPKALSVRTVASIWWFFTLIMVSSYTANLAAFLTVETPKVLIENVEDLANNREGVVYGAKSTGATRTFFMKSEDPIYKKMNAYMDAHPELLTESNADGVERVKSDKAMRYAFLMESTSIEYNTFKECMLNKVGQTLDEKGYGIAMKKGWIYSNHFNNALLQLQEQGELERLKKKWWEESGAGLCSAKAEKTNADALTMDNLGGIYIVLLAGSGLALIQGIISWICFVFRKARSHKVSFRAAFKEELKFVLEFTTYTRDLKTAASIYSPSRNSSCTIESLEGEENSMAKK